MKIRRQNASVDACTRAQSERVIRICRPSAHNLAGYDVWVDSYFQGWAHAPDVVRIMRDLLAGKRAMVVSRTPP